MRVEGGGLFFEIVDILGETRGCALGKDSKSFKE